MALDQVVNRGDGGETGALEDLGDLAAIDSRHLLAAFTKAALQHADERRIVESVDLEIGEDRPAFERRSLSRYAILAKTDVAILNAVGLRRTQSFDRIGVATTPALGIFVLFVRGLRHNSIRSKVRSLLKNASWAFSNCGVGAHNKTKLP